MANTKKIKSAEAEVVETAEVTNEVTNSAVEENEALKAKIAEQEQQMADLMAQIKVMMQAQAATNPVNIEEKAARGIKFISLVPGGLTLKGNRMYHIDKQFGYKMIPESEARAILSNMPNTIASGMVYIADKEFVNKNDLSGVYEEILSDKQLKELLQKNANDVCEIYKQASMAQREIIVDMVVNRKLNGLPIDANIVVEIGKLCGKDLMSITPEEEE
jgi:hypothetical protein|nr:MAG TPA: hypothetical protein [Caudoviricetes sp.]